MGLYPTPEEIITDEEIEIVHANAVFGDMPKREVVNLGVLKVAAGFRMGSTATQICSEHGLITKGYSLTKKGRQYLWAVYKPQGKDV
jgi:hypothetical protein